MTGGRARERFDDGWRFFRGEIRVPHTVKAGMLGGLADVAERKRGKHLIVAFVDREMGRCADPDRWPEVTLPHDFVVEEPVRRRADDRTHGFRKRGVGYYRKVFALPGAAREGKVWLEFDGIFRNSSVWVNGHHLADHRSGYTGLNVDISDVARFGDEGMNCVLVRADARDKEGWWYEGGGMYRHAWLSRAGRLHVVPWGVFVSTLRADRRRASVRVETTVANETAAAVPVTVETLLVDPRGRTAGRSRATVVLAAASRRTLRRNLSVRAPALWSPRSPRLYRALTRVLVAGRPVDSLSTRFGIRTVRFDPARGLILNGEAVPIKGTCNHQDFAGVGVALPDALHEYKIRVLKAIGCNAYRCAHHPPAPELLDACDRLGMLVLDENRKLDSSIQGLRDLEAMLYRDRNHPCVVLWGMENEEPLEGTRTGARILRRLVQRTRAIDPTRPTTAALNHGHLEGGYADQLDVHGFNYGHNRDKDVHAHGVRPWQPIVGTETNATPTTRGVYRDDKRAGHVNAYGTTVSPPPYEWNTGFTPAWRSYLKHPFLSGVFIWAGFDYRGEPSPYGWPCVNSHYGILDTCGFLKDSGWYHKAQFSREPVLHLMPHWNAPARRGAPVKVWALTNLERVELELNGRPLGGHTIEPGEVAEWRVPYEPGRLRATGFRNGRRAATADVETTGAPAAIRLEADRARLAADGRDAVPVRVAVVDSAGRVVPTARPLIRFSVTGPAGIIGVGNGDPSSHEPDKAERRRAFNGLAMVILQSTGRRGRTALRASSGSLRPGRLLLTSR